MPAAYAFLDPSSGPILAAYIVGIAVAQVLIFVLVKYLIVLRRRLVSNRAQVGELDEK